MTMNQMCGNVMRNLASMKLAMAALSKAAVLGMTAVCGTVLTSYLMENYLSHVGAAAPFYGALIIAVLYEIEPMYILQGLGTLETGEIVEIVTLIICGAVGSEINTAVSCSIVTLFFVDICSLLGVSCEIEISGKKGKVVIEATSDGQNTDNKAVNNSGGGSSGGSNNNWNHRDKYLKIVQNAALYRTINELYRETAKVGDGGTAAKLLDKFFKGEPLRHLQKSQEFIIRFNRILQNQNLTDEESRLVYQLLNDLYNAVKTVLK